MLDIEITEPIDIVINEKEDTHMTENNIEVDDLIEEYISNVNDGYIISLYNDDIGGDTVLTRDDFEDHFDSESKLDVIDRLDGDFDAADDYFMDSYVIRSSDDLFDLIEEDRVISHLENCLEDANDRWSMPEGFEDLYDEYIEQFKKPTVHSDDEIKDKIRELIEGVDDIELSTLSLMEEAPIYPISEFTTYVRGMSTEGVLVLLAKSIGKFSFGSPFYGIDSDDGSFTSYDRSAAEDRVFAHIKAIDKNVLRTEDIDLYNALNGEW